MNVYDYYSNYSTIFENIIIIILLLYYRKKFNLQEKHIIVWFTISSIVSLVGLVLWMQHHYNGWWYNLTNFIQYGYPGYIYYKYSSNPKIKKMILISFVAVNCFSIIRLSMAGIVYNDSYSTILFNILLNYKEINSKDKELKSLKNSIKEGEVKN